MTRRKQCNQRAEKHFTGYDLPEGGWWMDLFASSRNGDEVVVIGKAAEEETAWQQCLTRRAALSLWTDLTRILFPNRSGDVLAQVETTASLPEVNLESPYTTSVSVQRLENGDCELNGWVGQQGWAVTVSGYEVYRFWAALDQALYPSVW